MANGETRALMVAVGFLAAAILPFSAMAQTAPKEVDLHDSPLLLRGPPFEGAVARTTVRDNEVISQRTWNVFVTKPGEIAFITLSESLGDYYMMTRPRVRELHDPLLKQPAFPGATWGEGGNMRSGLGDFDYHRWTYNPATGGKQYCVAFVNYIDSAESGGWRKRMSGVFCGPREAGQTDLENGFRVLGIKGRYEPPPGVTPTRAPSQAK